LIKIKQLARLVALGLLAISLSGCSSSPAANTPAAQSAQSADNGSSEVQPGYRIDSEQPNRVAEIYGKVKSIQGNVAIIAEMERVQTGAQLSDTDRAARQQQMQSLSDEERKKLLASQEVMTGKNITITIPVGIPVKVRVSKSNGPAVEDGSISSIKAGSVVNIWTDSSDPSSAEYVNVANR
jgi:TolA-binding protein